MKRKIVSIVAVALASIALASCSGMGGVTETTSQSKDYYKLDYYDGLNSELGYNNDLFYVNKQMDVGPDPSVIYGKSKDGNNYFYIFPTSTNNSYFAYRSVDMANLQGAGTVFLPEEGSFLGGAMWAPDLIYDAEAPDGEGGKGLYYMFFTGQDKHRQTTYDTYYFDTREERASYKRLKAETNALSNADAISELDYGVGQFSQKVEELCEAYGVEKSGEVEKALTKYVNKKNVENGKNISEAEKQANIGKIAKEAIVSMKTADMHKALPKGSNPLAASIATAKTLDGPFVQYTNDGENGQRVLTLEDPFMIHEDLYKALNEKYGLLDGIHIIDMHAFVDPKNGDKYMYFNTDPCAPHSITSVAEIYVVKVGDKNARWTDDWQWDTITQLTRTGYVDMGNGTPKKDDAKSDLGESAINEGAYVVYNEKNGKYYLTISKATYLSKAYAVIQAVSDSPMGPFKKFSRAEGGILLQSETDWEHVIGPGHHSFVDYQGKKYIVYHTHDGRTSGEGNRVIAMDEVAWAKNNNGEWVLHSNGPSITPQLRVNNGYENIAYKAEVSASGGRNVGALTDGLISTSHEIDFVKEFTAEAGTTTVTLTFEEYRTVRALMIYNSKDYATAFKNVRRIELDFADEKDGKTVKGTAYIDNLKFNESYFYDNASGTYKCILPAAAATAEFDELHVKQIRITFSTDVAVNVSEIKVIGN